MNEAGKHEKKTKWKFLTKNDMGSRRENTGKRD